MKLHLIKKKTLLEFVLLYPSSKASVEDWLYKIRFVQWVKPNDILQTFSTADLLGNGSSRVVFDISGNHFRMICKYSFGLKKVHLFICWIGTHSEYDKLCKTRKQFEINQF
jgi:mRNA interferase HigB